MTPRQKLFAAAAAAILLILNIWQWWPRSPSGKGAGKGGLQSSRAARVEDFVIQAVPDGKLPPARRDVFQPKLPPVVKAPVPKKPPEPPPKTPEELAREAAQAEYATIRCLAVVFRGGRGQAMLSAGQQTYHVGVGDKVGSRFVVEKIEVDGVVIQDSQTGIGGKIGLSGTNR